MNDREKIMKFMYDGYLLVFPTLMERKDNVVMLKRPDVESIVMGHALDKGSENTIRSVFSKCKEDERIIIPIDSHVHAIMLKILKNDLNVKPNSSLPNYLSNLPNGMIESSTFMVTLVKYKKMDCYLFMLYSLEGIIFACVFEEKNVEDVIDMFCSM